MADDLEAQKWEFAKALFSIVLAQGILIAGLTKMNAFHWDMLRMIGKELGVELPEPAPLADPEEMAKMTEGIRQLNRMFGFMEGEKPGVLSTPSEGKGFAESSTWHTRTTASQAGRRRWRRRSAKRGCCTSRGSRQLNSRTSSAPANG